MTFFPLFTLILSYLSTLTLTKVITCTKDPCHISPTGDDTVICPSTHSFCYIDCSTPFQCAKSGTKQGLKVYAGSANIIISCKSEMACHLGQFYIGEQSLTIENYSPAMFSGKKTNFAMDCNSESACLEISVNIHGYFSNGISINALGTNSFKDSYIECNLADGNQLCALNCGRKKTSENSCMQSNFFCYGGDCDCYGTSCPNIVAFTPKPTTQQPTSPSLAPIIIPTSNPTNPTPIPTTKPTSNPVPSPTNQPTSAPLTPATLIFTPNGDGIAICDKTVDICIVNCLNREQCKKSKDGFKLYSAAKQTIINCNSFNSCQGAYFFIGIPPLQDMPKGYDSTDFDVKLKSIIIDCNADNSCHNVNVYVNACVENGLDMSALGVSTLDGASITCNLKPHQNCLLKCGEKSNESCTFSSMLCTGGVCQCKGDTCPLSMYTFTPKPTPVTVNPTLKPTELTTAPTRPPTPTPTLPTVEPTTRTPTSRPTNLPTKSTLIPTKIPTILPTISTLIPTDIPTRKPTEMLIKTFTPDGDSFIICPNSVHTCIINCFGYQQCKPAGDNSLTVYSAAKNTIINCNNRDSCIDAVFYIGIPSILPPGTNIEDFLGDFTSVRIDCNYISSCKGAEIHIKGNFSAGVTMNGNSVESFADGFLKCHIGDKQDCILNCGQNHDRSCKGSDYICYGGNCQCTGESCPKVLHETPVPNIPGYFACEPLSSTNECHESKIFEQERMLDCPWGYSCCACDHVICTKCEEVNCGSTYSCAGTNLTINGNIQGGASLTCGDNWSCMYSTIIGENINRIGCAGDMSCQYTYMELNMNSKKLLAVEPLEIPCNGDESCQNTFIQAKNLKSINCNGDVSCSNTTFIFECFSTNINVGCSLICSGDNACQFSTWDITNVDRLQCTGDETCQHGIYDILCLMIGCPVICTGPRACVHALFNIDNVVGFDCSGIDSCSFGTFYLDSIKPGAIHCDDLHSCYGASITMNEVTAINCNRHFSCAESFFDVKCEKIEGCALSCGIYGCQNSNIYIENELTLINCWDDMSCENATITAKCSSSNPCPLICSQNGCQNSNITISSNFKKFNCLAGMSCENMTLNAICNNDNCNGGCDVTCGVHGCEKSNITLKGSTKGINCTDIFACAKTKLNVETTYNKFFINCATWGCKDSIINIKPKVNSCSNKVVDQPKIDFILCGNTQACYNSIINIDASDYPGKLIIDNITCSGHQSCYNTQIRIIGNIQVNNIECNPASECEKLTVCNPYSQTINKCPTPAPTNLPTLPTPNPTPSPPTYPTNNPTYRPTKATPAPIAFTEVATVVMDNKGTLVYSIVFTFLFIIVCTQLIYCCRKYKWYKKWNADDDDNNNLTQLQQQMTSLNPPKASSKSKIQHIKLPQMQKSMNVGLINNQPKPPRFMPTKRGSSSANANGLQLNKKNKYHSRQKSGYNMTGNNNNEYLINNNNNDNILDDKGYLDLYYDTFNNNNENENEIDDDNELDLEELEKIETGL